MVRELAREVARRTREKIAGLYRGPNGRDKETFFRAEATVHISDIDSNVSCDVP
jgi:hypothetical protein